MRASRRDYEAIAKALHSSLRAAHRGRPAAIILDALAVQLADILEASNASFDRDRFFAACWGDLPHNSPKEPPHA